MLPLHVERHSVDEFSDVNPISSPTHSPGMSHCRADMLPKVKNNNTNKVLFISTAVLEVNLSNARFNKLSDSGISVISLNQAMTVHKL